MTLVSSHIDSCAAHSGFILGLTCYKQPFFGLTSIGMLEQTITQGLLVRWRAGRQVLMTVDKLLRCLTGKPKGLKIKGI